MHAQDRWGSVLLGVLALASPTLADDDGTTPAEPAHAWKAGDLTQVEYRSQATSVERGAGEDGDSTYSLSRDLRLDYLDRIDDVRDGQVRAITRHFKRARLVEDGGDELTLLLEGRSVSLTRDAQGQVRAAWSSGGLIESQARAAAKEGPWPDVDREWGLHQGTRQGQLQNALIEDWQPGVEVPGFVTAAVQGFTLDRVRQATWKLEVTDAFDPAGRFEGQLSLEGREEDGNDALLDVRQKLTLSLVRRVTTAKALPKSAPLPADESMDEPLDDAPLEFEDDDDGMQDDDEDDFEDDFEDDE